MLNSQTFNPNMAEVAQFQKLGQHFLRPPQETKESKPEVPDQEGTINWLAVEEKEGKLELKAVANTTQVDVTSISIHNEEVSAPKSVNFLGYKIDLKAKIDNFKESYIKNYALTKSHNLMVARFAELKTSTYGYLLSLLGFSSEDVRKLQKKAIEVAVKQNKLLFEENEYNSELLSIVGGGGRKQLRAQERVTAEIRSQLALQMKNLGLGDHYTSRKVLEIQIEQCKKIADKFQEEKTNLEYQLAIFGAN